MRVNSACLTGVGTVEVRQRELELGADEVLVKVHAAGICGQDKNLFNGISSSLRRTQHRDEDPFAYPYFFGHEAGGTVVEVGKDVRQYRTGDRVLAFALVETSSDDPPGWRRGTRTGAWQVWRWIWRPSANPSAVRSFLGLCSQVQLGDTVAVIGMGFAGQVIAQIAKKKGAHRVIGVDVVTGKLQLASRLGLDHAVNSSRPTRWRRSSILQEVRAPMWSSRWPAPGRQYNSATMR